MLRLTLLKWRALRLGVLGFEAAAKGQRLQKEDLKASVLDLRVLWVENLEAKEF